MPRFAKLLLLTFYSNYSFTFRIFLFIFSFFFSLNSVFFVGFHFFFFDGFLKKVKFLPCFLDKNCFCIFFSLEVVLFVCLLFLTIPIFLSQHSPFISIFLYSCFIFMICIHIFFSSFIPLCKYLNNPNNKIYVKMLASDTFCNIFARDRGYQKQTFSLITKENKLFFFLFFLIFFLKHLM